MRRGVAQTGGVYMSATEGEEGERWEADGRAMAVRVGLDRRLARGKWNVGRWRLAEEDPTRLRSAVAGLHRLLLNGEERTKEREKGSPAGGFTSGEARSGAEHRAAVADHGQGWRSDLAVGNPGRKRLGGGRTLVRSGVGEGSSAGCAGTKEMRRWDGHAQ